MVLLAVLLLAQPTAVRATRMFDARRGTIVQPGLVVVDGERIVQVAGAAPAGARTIDLGDATLLPGLMDAHTHLSFESGASWYRDALDLVFRWPAEQAQYAAEYARRAGESGFTTVRDLGSADFIDVGLKKAIDAGAVPGPRMIAAVHAVGSRGGHADLDPYHPTASRRWASGRGSATAPRRADRRCAGRSSTAPASSSWSRRGASSRLPIRSTTCSSRRPSSTPSSTRRTGGDARPRRTATATRRRRCSSARAWTPSSTARSSSPTRCRR